MSILPAMALLALALPGPAPRPVRLALVSDTHISGTVHGDQAAYRDRLDRAVLAVNAANVDAVLLAGDLTNGGTAADFAEFARRIRGLRKRPLLVPGNHDVGNAPKPGGAEAISAERLAAYEHAAGPSFYVRRARGLRIVAVDASLMGSGLPREAEQWAFLERELARPVRTVLLVHYPPFVKTQDEPGDPYWNIEPAPRARLLALLKPGGVIAVLAGHLHRPLEIRQDGILFYATPPVSFGLPPGKQPEGWTLVTVWPDGRVETEFKPI